MSKYNISEQFNLYANLVKPKKDEFKKNIAKYKKLAEKYLDKIQ